MKASVVFPVFLASLFFFQCSSGTGNGKGSVILLDQKDTLAIINSTGNAVTIENIRGICENGIFSQETVTSTTLYEITDGNLLTWQEGDCAKIV